MRLLRKLIPDFLRELDLDLQRKHPRLWSTRIHYHLWFLLLINAVVFALGLVLHVEHRRFPDPGELFGYMMVPAVVYLACWTYRVVRFNVEKRFGIRRPYAEVGEFLIHLVSLLLIMSIPYTLALTVAWRIAHLTTDEEFVEEVNTLNEQAPWFYGTFEYNGTSGAYIDYHNYDEHDYEEMVSYAVAEETMHKSVTSREGQGGGTHRFFRDLEDYRLRKDEETRIKRLGNAPLHGLYKDYIKRANLANDPRDTANHDPDTARTYFAMADSIEASFPLLFVRHGLYTSYGGISDSLLEVAYVERVRANEPMDPQAIERALAIGMKYKSTIRDIGADSVLAQFQRRVPSTAGLYGVKEQMGLVAKAKWLHYFFTRWEGTATLLLITCFVLALLVSIFKNIHWQPFLIAVVAAALLPVLLSVFALITEHWLFAMRQGTIMMYGYWWIAVALIASVPFTMRLNAYRTTLAVTTILANVAVPFIAFFTLVILHDEFDVFGLQKLNGYINELHRAAPHDPMVKVLGDQLDELRRKVDRIMQYTLWGGMVLYLLVLHPLFRRVYTRLMALPERR